MTAQPSKSATSVVTEAFEGPWRDDAPVFGCCRRTVARAADAADLHDLATRDVTTRVRRLREVVEQEAPGHLASHRCCVGHLADLGFDLPDLLAPTAAEAPEQDV